ncbi:hypothetical protein OAK48_00385 [Deltaproteobacteria bacterium]|nr:hypothetical protein [Deltaproteobacteria bacterium]
MARIAGKLIILVIHFRRAVFSPKQASGISKSLFNTASTVSTSSFAAKAS